ncbi:MAG: hypothetical protein HY537_06495, partial [Deltaproteobacteria bacterium]|nr:hypothetical protein [Deltaproteobacteria bacterium]
MYVYTGATNIGFIAVDDYWDVVSRITPAQYRTPESIIEKSGFRSPVPQLILFQISRLAFYLGVTEPAAQLKWILVFVAIFSFVFHSIFSIKHFRLTAD